MTQIDKTVPGQKSGAIFPDNVWIPKRDPFRSPTPTAWKNILPDTVEITALRRKYSWDGNSALAAVSRQPERANTCIAHAACRMLETHLAVGGTRVRLDADQLHQCGFKLSCWVGLPTVSEGLEVMAYDGVPGMNGFSAGSRCPHASPVARLPSYRRLMTTDEIKHAIAETGPVVIVMTIGNVFRELRGNAVYRGEPGGVIEGHAVLITGFDDDEAGGVWKAQNSYGSDWNDRGFVRIAYGVASILSDESFSAFCID